MTTRNAIPPPLRLIIIKNVVSGGGVGAGPVVESDGEVADVGEVSVVGGG